MRWLWVSERAWDPNPRLAVFRYPVCLPGLPSFPEPHSGGTSELWAGIFREEQRVVLYALKRQAHIRKV